MKRMIGWLAWMACAAIMPARAQNPGVGTLAGVTNAAILVEPLKSELAQQGLTAAQIARDIEGQLRLAGLPVAEDTGGGTPFLYVRVSAVPAAGRREPIYAYHVDLHFQQFAFLRRDGQLALVPTWRDGATGVVGVSDVLSLRDVIRTLVIRFLADFKAANRPEPAPGPAGGGAPEAVTREAP